MIKSVDTIIKKSNAGRKSLLTEEMVQKLKDYIDDPQIAGHPFPSQLGFCFYAKIDDSTHAKWKIQQKDNPNYEEFFSTFGRLSQLSQLSLIHGSLLGEFKEGISKFTLSAWHNYRDKSDVTSKDEKLDSLSSIIAEINNKQPPIVQSNDKK